MKDYDKNSDIEQEECDYGEQTQESIELNDYLLQHQVLPSVSLDFTDVENMSVDSDAFYEGVKEASKIAGFATVLKHVGMDNQAIMDYLLTLKNIEHAQRLQQIINENNIEVSKIQGIKIEQQTL